MPNIINLQGDEIKPQQNNKMVEMGRRGRGTVTGISREWGRKEGHAEKGKLSSMVGGNLS